MSVIGRLDKQVDEIIIRPVSERNRHEGRETDADSQETIEQPQTATHDAASPHEEKRVEQPSASSERSTDLPVWLL